MGGSVNYFSNIFAEKHPLELNLYLNQSRDLYTTNKKDLDQKKLMKKIESISKLEMLVKIRYFNRIPFINRKGKSLF